MNPHEPAPPPEEHAGHPTTAHDTASRQGHGEIDVEALADRVYRLMLEDVRRERSRAGIPLTGRGR